MIAFDWNWIGNFLRVSKFSEKEWKDWSHFDWVEVSLLAWTSSELAWNYNRRKSFGNCLFRKQEVEIWNRWPLSKQDWWIAQRVLCFFEFNGVHNCLSWWHYIGVSAALGTSYRVGWSRVSMFVSEWASFRRILRTWHTPFKKPYILYNLSLIALYRLLHNGKLLSKKCWF